MALLFKKSPFREGSVDTVSVSAAKIFDHSWRISKYGEIGEGTNVPPQRGRSAFATTESLLCLFGLLYGEEVETIAYRR